MNNSEEIFENLEKNSQKSSFIQIENIFINNVKQW